MVIVCSRCHFTSIALYSASVHHSILWNIHTIDFYNYSKLWYYMEWHVDNMWHSMWRGKLHHKPNKHILPHHFTPVARENENEYKVQINNNK